MLYPTDVPGLRFMNVIDAHLSMNQEKFIEQVSVSLLLPEDLKNGRQYSKQNAFYPFEEFAAWCGAGGGAV